jgi:hypothetical protein
MLTTVTEAGEDNKIRRDYQTGCFIHTNTIKNGKMFAAKD